MPTLLAVATATGLVLRMFPLRSIWLDEAISIQQAQQPYLVMLHQLSRADIHPPLWGSVLWVDVRLFGYSPLAVRFPSIVIGTLSIPLAYLVARELYDRRTGVVAAFFLAVSPIAVWYSGEARMYAFYLFWALLATWGQARAIRRGHPGDWALFILASGGLVYTHYFALLQLCAQHLVFAVLAVRGRRGYDQTGRDLLVPWLLSVAATIALVSPLMPYTAQQVRGALAAADSLAAAAASGSGGGTGFVSPYVVLANVVWATLGYHPNDVMAQLVALWPVGLLLVLFLLGKGRSRASMLLATLVVAPLAFTYLVSVKNRSYFELRYFVSVVPALLILASRAVATFRDTMARTAAAGAVALMMVVGLGYQQLGSSNPRRYAYNQAFRLVQATARAGDTILFVPYYLDPLMRYYRPAVTAVPVEDGVPLPTKPAGQVILLASYLDKSDNIRLVGQTLAQLESRGRSVRQVAHMDNVTVWVLR